MVCSNFYTGSGTSGQAYGATVGDGCLAGGVVTANELNAGYIPHALFGLTNCFAPNSYVYPAYQPGDTTCSDPNGIPNGAHIWLDLNDTQINALPITAAEKTILRAIHDYGIYILDTGAGAAHPHGLVGLSDTFESEAAFSPFGVTPPIATWAQSQGWHPVTIYPRTSGFTTATRYVFSDTWNPLSSVGGWQAHLHVLDPCSARGTC
jgi:hypothetical protein